MSTQSSKNDHDSLLRRWVAEAENTEVAEVDDRRLATFFRVCASIATRAYPCATQSDIEDEAMGIVCQALFDRASAGYDPTRNCFKPWCIAVLRNWATDLVRKRTRKRKPPRTSDIPDQTNGRPASEPDPSLDHTTIVEMAVSNDRLANEPDHRPERPRSVVTVEGISRWSQAFRQVLDGIAWRCEKKDIDYFAVLLLNLRLKIAARVFDVGFASPDEPAKYVASLLPWHPDEEQRLLSKSLPTLGQVWQALASDMNKPPTSKSLCVVVNQLAAEQGCSASLNDGCWRKWCERAREEAEKRTNPEQWQQYFESWLPQRARGDQEQ